MPKGNLPTHKGQVCDENQNKLGVIALWMQKPEELKSGKSPVLRGQIEFDKDNPYVRADMLGKIVKVALWVNSIKPIDSAKPVEG